MEPSRSLADLQQWMLRSVMSSGNHGAAIPDVILPSAQLDAELRLQIYRDAYVIRLVLCLGDEYPAVKAAISEHTFFGFARKYLQQYPPSSYTLNVLGARFPDFLRETRPADVPPLSWPDFLIDLARLESLYAQVFDGPGVEHLSLLTPDDLTTIAPNEWPDCRLRPVPCLRLEQFAFPVHLFASAVRQGAANPDIPAPEPTFLIVTRREYIVRRTAVSEAEFRLLQAIVAGETIESAIEQVAADWETELVADLQNWFRRWATAGYFLSVERP